ncbi:MAG TPA: isoprenylcysteine carboxylmethyltransferase family protein [Sphingomicrobium sp.]
MMSKLLLQLTALICVFAAIIFSAAGTLDYWQAWVFLACYFLASLALSLWLVRHDPELLQRRMRGGPFAEGERSQKVIMTLTSLGFVAGLVVPGLDRRHGWSEVPPVISFFADLVHLAGWLGIWFVFRANTYAAATIKVDSGQTVISTGPYAIVRHPMYGAALFMILAIPVALASWWGLLVFVVLLPALVWRLLDEERVLVRDLEGYAEYRRKVRWRLVPGIW